MERDSTPLKTDDAFIPAAEGAPPRAPQAATLKRSVQFGASLALSAWYLALIFAFLWRPDFRTTSPRHAALSLIAFYIDTFAFHGGLAAAVGGALLAVGRKWRLGLAALPAVVFTVGPELRGYWPHQTPRVSGRTVTVMSANLLGSSRDTGSLAREITAADPDLLFVQEYTEFWHEAVFSAVGTRYPYVVTIPRGDNYGMAVYSKLPFTGSDPVRLTLAGLTKPCLKTTVLIDERPVTFISVHLVPPKGVEHFRQQCAQLADLLEVTATESNPVTLVGDFNFTPRSRLGGALRHLGLTTCHDLAGWGRGTTWPVDGLGRYLPGLRIDHIYLSPELTCVAYRTGVGEGSDHRPVLARIGLAR